jgi:hypothetical protein
MRNCPPGCVNTSEGSTYSLSVISADGVVIVVDTDLVEALNRGMNEKRVHY